MGRKLSRPAQSEEGREVKQWLFVIAMCCAMTIMQTLPDSVTPRQTQGLAAFLLWVIGWMGAFTDFSRE